MVKKLNKTVDSRLKRSRVKTVNDEQPNDRLQILKEKYDQEIQAKEQELVVLKSKREHLLKFAQESDELRNVNVEEDRYANMGMTDAVIDALNCLWKSGKDTRITAPDIRNYLIFHGIPLEERTKNFHVALSVTLKRLADSKRIVRVDENGKIFYKPVIQRPRTLEVAAQRGRSLRSK